MPLVKKESGAALLTPVPPFSATDKTRSSSTPNIPNPDNPTITYWRNLDHSLNWKGLSKVTQN